jgi:hypothetical protein
MDVNVQHLVNGNVYEMEHQPSGDLSGSEQEADRPATIE